MNPQRRSVRLTRLQELFKGKRAGYTAEELARLTGMHVRSVQRDLLTLQTELNMPLMKHGARYALLEGERLRPLDLTLQQARALLIAIRLFLRYSDEGDPDASGALQAVARVMPAPIRDLVIAAAASMERKPVQPQFARNIATVTDAWARRRVLRLSYRSAGRARPKEVVVEPYFIEPSAAGFATYLIGYSRTHSSLRTFKVERIVSAEMLPLAFGLPADFNIDALLTSAWGIIWGEGIDVRLRFKAAVAWRVKESRWHPSQAVEDLPDGGCILTMSVASMLELGRWVRSWGDTVEVLAPAALRQELREESVRLARIYARDPVPVRRKRAARPAKAGDKRQGRLA
ncbi:MAG TPA: WYL domain-containing protein [Dehalococcoidia bacterium]